MHRTDREWDENYRADEPPPWDIGAVQPALANYLDDLELADPVLDAGCGTGEVAIRLGLAGHLAYGFDISPKAIALARRKASALDISVDFRVADARHLAEEGVRPRTVVDCGLMHILDVAARSSYVDGLARVCQPGAKVVVLAVSPEADEGWDMSANELAGWFDNADWNDANLQDITVHARWNGEELRFPGYLFTTHRSFERPSQSA